MIAKFEIKIVILTQLCLFGNIYLAFISYEFMYFWEIVAEHYQL